LLTGGIGRHGAFLQVVVVDAESVRPSTSTAKHLKACEPLPGCGLQPLAVGCLGGRRGQVVELHPQGCRVLALCIGLGTTFAVLA